ncbi:MAG: DUF3796 domain-containing protein [Dehalococcoidales bacterium]|nr:DUF3796 domain-containing protein [Dehalococcoidales bacterium]
MKKWLTYVGFLGFLGLLGLFTGNPAFYGIFNFFGFWSLANRKRKSDELLVSNMARAGLNAFIASLIAVSLTIAVLSVFKTLAAAQISIAGIFTAQLLTFIISLNYYERRGNV